MINHPDRFNTYGARWDTETRIFMAYVVAKALGRSPHSLPELSDGHLWGLYRKASKITQPFGDIPPQIVKLLNFGDIFALTVGDHLKSDVFPTGECLREIFNSAVNGDGRNREEMKNPSWSQLYFVAHYTLVKTLMATMKHPKKEWYAPDA